MFMPLSALTGAGLNKRVPKNICPWYDGPSLLEYLDDMKTLERKLKAPFMMPIISKYRVYYYPAQVLLYAYLAQHI